MTTIEIVLAFAFVLTTMPITHAADIAEKEICAAALERLFDRRSINRYVKTATEGKRNVHVFASRKDSRNSDGCYIQGNRAIWRVESAPGMSQGRWRDDPSDEVVTYSLSGDKLIIALKYSDGSGDSKTFSLSKLTGAIK